MNKNKDQAEGDKIRFPCGSTFTIFSMLENTPLHGQLFQMTDDLTGELFTEPVEYLKHVEFIPNATGEFPAEQKQKGKS